MWPRWKQQGRCLNRFEAHSPVTNGVVIFNDEFIGSRTGARSHKSGATNCGSDLLCCGSDLLIANHESGPDVPHHQDTPRGCTSRGISKSGPPGSADDEANHKPLNADLYPST